MSDSAQLKKLAKVQRFSTLSDISDRDDFFATLDEQCSKVKTSRSPMALIIFDIAEFRSLNTICGHNICDEVLLEVCNRIRLTLRESDTIFRIGSDEFAVIMMNLKLEQAIKDGDLSPRA